MRCTPAGLLWLALLACENGPAQPIIDDRGCEPVVTPGRPTLELFVSPFVGSFPLGNYFDHDLPFQFEDDNGFQLTFCGSRVVPGTDGHWGYDWFMPVGTPLQSVGDGEVVVAADFGPLFCPPLGDSVSSLLVAIRHPAPGGTVYVSVYDHLDRIDVAVGQMVVAGEQIGLSGDTGCSTAPHLHFGVEQEVAGGTIKVDPYGWQGPGEDPWAAHPEGAESVWLWRSGEAPPVAR